MVAINSESSFWPRCDNSQNIKGSAVGYVFGLYCSREWVTHLNIMLKDLGYCQNRPVIRNFLTQAAYETGYYSTLGQPIDDGSGIIHMIPSNWASNVDDMDALFPTDGLKAEYLSRDATGRKNFFKEPAYAWKSAAAWFKRTNRNIPGCGKDIFPLSLDEQTKCILGRVVDRTQAYDLVSKHIPLLPVSPTPAVVTQPPSQPPTTPPTGPPTFQFIPPTAAPPTASGGTGSSTGCEGVPAYSNGATYVYGDKAVFENRVYQAKWWTRGEEPNLGGAWTLVHWCKTEAGVVDESARVCGGISEWLSSAIYNGGALVHFKNTVYKAKWWSRGTEPDVADSWSKQSDCAKMEAALPTSTENAKDPALVLGVDNVVNTEADQQASGQPFSVYLSILLDNIQGGKTAKDLEPMEQSLISVLEVQYGIFVPKNSIKDIVFKQRGPSSVEMIAQLHFSSLHAAEDAQAVMAQYESTVRETIKQMARRYEVEVGDVAVAGSSVVAEGIDVEISASPSTLPSSFAIVLTSTLVGYFVRQ
jgi:chitodextrinase